MAHRGSKLPSWRCGARTWPSSAARSTSIATCWLRALHRSKQPTGLFRPGKPDRSASVGWEVHDRETSDFAAEVLKHAVWSERCLTSPLVLHADNGRPMKGATMKVTMDRLGVIASFSRPRVSNDNPFSEALFRTRKYTPRWPTRGFATIDEARAWVQSFVQWYNTEHRHSAIRFVTPDQRHRGEDKALLAERHRVYQRARAAHPERWSGRTRNWQPIGSVWLNPERPDDRCRSHGSADALPHEAGGDGPMAGPVDTLGPQVFIRLNGAFDSLQRIADRRGRAGAEAFRHRRGTPRI